MTTLLLPYCGIGGCRYDVQGVQTAAVWFLKNRITGHDFFCKWRLRNGKIGYENFVELKRGMRVSLKKVGRFAVRYVPTFHKNMLPPL